MTTYNSEVLQLPKTTKENESRRSPEKIARYNIIKGFDLLDRYNIEDKLSEIKNQFFPDWKIIKTPNDNNLFRYIKPSPFDIATLELAGPRVETCFFRSEFPNINDFHMGYESIRVQAKNYSVSIAIMLAFYTCQESLTFGTPKNPTTTTILTKDPHHQEKINNQIQDILNQGCLQIKKARELRDSHYGQFMARRICLY